MNRRSGLLLAAAAGLATTGCFGKRQPELTATDILAKASEALKSVKSVHFKLSATNGSMVIGSGLAAKTIEGDVAQPDRIKGTATSSFGKLTVEIGFIVVGPKEYITNPITKKWQLLPGDVTAPNLLDPQHGAAALLKQTTSPKKLADATVDGTACYHVSGNLAASLIAGLIGAKGLDRSLAGDLWIGKSDFLVRQIHLVGPITADEPPKIERTLVLSQFNESISITAPPT